MQTFSVKQRMLSIDIYLCPGIDISLTLDLNYVSSFKHVVQARKRYVLGLHFVLQKINECYWLLVVRKMDSMKAEETSVEIMRDGTHLLPSD